MIFLFTLLLPLPLLRVLVGAEGDRAGQVILQPACDFTWDSYFIGSAVAVGETGVPYTDATSVCGLYTSNGVSGVMVLSSPDVTSAFPLLEICQSQLVRTVWVSIPAIVGLCTVLVSSTPSATIGSLQPVQCTSSFGGVLCYFPSLSTTFTATALTTSTVSFTSTTVVDVPAVSTTTITALTSTPTTTTETDFSVTATVLFTGTTSTIVVATSTTTTESSSARTTVTLSDTDFATTTFSYTVRSVSVDVETTTVVGSATETSSVCDRLVFRRQLLVK